MVVSLLGATAVLVALSSESATGLPHPDSSLSRARRLLDEGNIGEARKLFEEELRRDIKSVEAIRGLALCARDEGDDEMALQHFQKVTALVPKDRAAWRQQALAASRLGRDMEALSAAQTALSLAPEGDRAMSDLMTRLLTSDADLLADPLKGVPGRRKGLDPVDRGAKGLDFDPLDDMPRPEPPDPTRGLPRPGRGD
jgi:tetratricopeptide (TPR) repeat protein